MRTAFAAVAVLLALDLQAAISAGPERAASPAVFGPGYGIQYPLELASDGEDFLALWLEQTEGRDGIYAAIVDEHGATRPMPARRLLRGGQLSHVHVVWTGDAYLLVYSASEPRQTFAARVSRDAEHLGESVPIGSGETVPVALAWNGQRALMVTADIGDHALTAVTFTPDGTIEQTTTLPDVTNDFRVAAAAAGETFVVTWTDARNTTTASGIVTTTAVRAMRLDGRGASIDAQPATLVAELPGNVRNLGAASDGERIGVAFVAEVAAVGGSDTLRAFVIDPGTLTIAAQPPQIADGRFVEVIATPRGFVAGTLSGSRTFLRLMPFGGGEPAQIFIGLHGGIDLHLAASNTAVLAVWSDYRVAGPYGPYRHLFGVPLDVSATAPIGEIAPLGFSAVAQANPAIAPSREHSLLIWTDLTRTARGELVGVRVDRSGNVLDAAPLVIDSDVDQYTQPAVTFTGEVWLVAWTSSSQPAKTSIRRVSADGQLLDGTEEIVGWGSAFASNGTVTVLAVGNSVVRFAPHGALIDVTQASTHGGYLPGIATNGREFLMAWTEGSDWWQFPSPNWRDIWAIRLDVNGVPFGGPIAVAAGKLDEGEPRVASDSRDFLVAYHYDKTEVRGKRVLRNGTLADATVPDPGMLISRTPTLLALSRAHSGYVAVVASELGSPAHISALPLDQKGTPSGPPLLLAIDDFQRPAATLGYANDSLLVAYARTVAGPPFEGIPRVFVRTLNESSMRRRSVR